MRRVHRIAVVHSDGVEKSMTTRRASTDLGHLGLNDQTTPYEVYEGKFSFRAVLQNTLKAWSFHSLYRLFYNVRDSIRNQTKVVIFKNRPMALLAIMVHVPPLVATAIMSHLIYHEYWIGADLTPNREWDKSANLLIQFAAKFLEIMIIGSLTTMIFTFVRREVTLGQGTPLAAFFAGNSFSSPEFLWSDEMTAMLRGRFSTVWKKVFFVSFLVMCCVLAVVVAPATATVLTPLNDWWMMGGSWVYIDKAGADIFPRTLTAADTVAGDVYERAGNLDCPSAGWDSLTHLVSYLPYQAILNVTKGSYIRIPALFPLATPESILQLSISVREPGVPRGWAESRMTLPHRVTGATLAATMMLWQDALTLMNQKEKKYYRGLDYRYSTFQELASMETRCRVTMVDGNNTTSGDRRRPVNFPEVRNEASFTNNTDIMALENPTTQALWTTLNRTTPQLSFFDIDPKGDLAANVSIGAIISLPRQGGIAVYGCLTDAEWIGANTWINIDNHVWTDGWPFPVTWKPGSRKVLIETSFANLTNAAVDIEGTTVFQRLAASARLVDSPLGLPWTVGHVETLVNAMLANGMSRTAPAAKPIITLKDADSAWWRNFFPRKTQFGFPESGTAFDVPEAVRAAAQRLHFRGEMKGFAYSAGDDTVRYSMVGLFVYCTVAVAFMAWSLVAGVTSKSWESTPELLALAMRSPPPGDEKMPSSILEDTSALRERYCIVASGSDVLLRPMDGLDEVPEEMRVRPNVMYR
ncbi:hypothetical protein CTAM01_05786 [Colletotrichum tamarilloi]|uniref:Uncharacterized protein n=1 Tax=Colletotrichum tamarilloi TaxID=1209934 RepID=A0ABQ9RDP1_9PEZI|nr:uncharacterized protein CTAM01_05786 [Colletotrichum tamarilloi]KAK1501562.1 hypothetical protein CTAM01_05786 [Colletotrichum tamarilloi]